MEEKDCMQEDLGRSMGTLSRLSERVMGKGGSASFNIKGQTVERHAGFTTKSTTKNKQNPNYAIVRTHRDQPNNRKPSGIVLTEERAELYLRYGGREPD